MYKIKQHDSLKIAIIKVKNEIYINNKEDTLKIKPSQGSKLDSNKLSIGIHFFKVLVQIHYSHSPARGIANIKHIFVNNLMKCVIICLILSSKAHIEEAIASSQGLLWCEGL